MANTLANLARVASSTTGAGTLTLGAAATGCLTFADAGVANGAVVTYAIEDYDGSGNIIAREIGAGTYSTTGPTLSRDTVYSSTNAGSQINCSGLQHVFVTASKEDFASLLTSAAAAAAYQPLDADLTTLATNITAFGHDLVDSASASAARSTLGLGTMATETASNYLTTSAAASGYQPLDSELTAIAGLTSAADQLPYFTGSGAASLATFTTAGRNLVDDADASAQRTTLGLGTAATQNTGTSGANIPFLNGTNTWSAINTFSSGQIFGAASTMATGEVNTVSADAGAGFGPLVRYIRDSASPAANDGLGGFQFLGRSDAAGEVTYADVLAQAIAVSAGSTQGHLRFRTDTNGSAVSRLTLQLGAQIGSPTGGDKGAGTLNATTLYEAGTALTAKYARLGTANVLTGILSVNGAGANAPLCVKSDFGTYGGLNSGVRVETAAVATVGALCEIASGEGAIRLYTGGSEIIRLRAAGASYFGAQAFGLGTTSPDRRLHSEVDDATTNAVTQVARFTHTTSGTPATGIGVGIEFEVETAAGNNEVGATIEAVSTDVTSTSEDFDLVVKAMAAGAAAAEVGRHKSTGTYKMPVFTVANLPAGTAGEISFASNGRKNGEGAAAGTGVLVFHDGTAWRACDTGATVAA